MKLLIQRVSEAAVETGGKTVGQISRGCLVLLGISNGDTEEKADKAVDKIAKLRLFADENGKTNLSLTDIGGGLLVVSQFTLCADCRRGNRPGFSGAAEPRRAEELYEYFLKKAALRLGSVQHGIFGADMKVRLVNDGPFTIILEDGNGL
ncbi:MAG TPA: D-tyrosyl-tRNA(Tyr) deacylase [Candidatus Monoglobus merdigallinarum]|uniref:D-aminoacyl-tRNA deacylase n=1 Tax=Candidatus Monoglobus merdigallinarum TaxID=2838698 RepID=A0A9D1PSG5_9FIRM|nr:D-tyrosyl-tRNA(Tyr) deacylase [Candidatus Monoglobus merdigallinarum]